MISSPLVSVIIPVYNAEDYLPACLDSLLCQTLTEIEILLIDDGSTDGSGRICDACAAKDARVRVIHQENQGVSRARNQGIEHAAGEYILLVDSDDWAEPTLCEQLYMTAEAHHADLCICANYNETDTRSTVRKLFPHAEILFTGDAYKKEILIPTLGLVGEKLRDPSRLDRLTPVWARLYKTSVIRDHKIRFVDTYKLPSEALQFNFEFSVHARSAVYIDRPLYHYRRSTPGSVSKSHRDDLWEKWRWWIEYMKKYISENCDDPDVWKAFHSRICCSVIPLGGNAALLHSCKSARREAKAFLRQEVYRTAFSDLDASACPFYWRVFFFSAKHRLVTLYLFLTMCMRKILKRRKA